MRLQSNKPTNKKVEFSFLNLKFSFCLDWSDILQSCENVVLYNTRTSAPLVKVNSTYMKHKV